MPHVLCQTEKPLHHELLQAEKPIGVDSTKGACRLLVQRSIALAMLLADLSASGVPVDAVSIAAAVVVDGVAKGLIPMDMVHTQLGMEVCYASLR